jgi:hypothetical protein
MTLLARPDKRTPVSPKTLVGGTFLTVAPSAGEPKVHGRWWLHTSTVRHMEDVVLRVRLMSGDSMDVTYEHRDAGSKADAVNQVIATLSEASGVLRCRHGDRLVVLYARGVAAVEIAPRGAVL